MKKAKIAIYIPNMDADTFEKICQEKGLQFVYVEVPEHGRLGDLDALAGRMQRNLFEIEDKAEKELGFDETLRRGMQYGHAVCVDAVNDAPTIIPADYDRYGDPGGEHSHGRHGGDDKEQPGSADGG